MIKSLISLILVNFFFTCSILSQEQFKSELFNIEINKKATEFKSNTYFYKAANFFIQKEWDSTLVYSAKQLNNSIQNNSLYNYSHYFRGYSFKQKKLLNEAEKEFNLISTEFQFYYTVRMFLGELALEKSQFKKAIPYFEQLIELPEKEYLFFKKSTIINNLGICYSHLKQFKKAETYLIESIHLQEQQKDTIKLTRAYGNIANLYYEQYKDKLAISYFQKAYLLAKKTKSFDLKRLTSKNLAVVEENRKEFKKALIFRKEFEKWKDSLTDQNKIWEVAQLEKEFALKEKQKEVSLLQAENKIKEAERNKLLYSAIALLILLGAGAYFYREKVKSNQIITEQKENLNELNATKDKLFSIVSHDLRSSVNALKNSNTSLIDNLDSNNLKILRSLLQNNSAIVNGAYSLLDNLLHWALSQTKQEYFEIVSMRLFFITEQVAYNYKPLLFDKNIQFENKILKSDRIYADQESLKLIIRNLLDNAIKFSKGNGKIKIYTKNEQENYCDFIIEDTGIGMSMHTIAKLLEDNLILSKKENKNSIGTGLGLQLCKSMIQKNKGKFSIESELGKGTKMIVSLPKNAPNG